MGDFLQAIPQILGIVLGSSSATTLSAVGLILLLIAAVMVYVGFEKKPEENSISLKVALYLCLIGGLVFSAAGPSLALYDTWRNPIRVRTSDEILDRLAANARVRYVIRLISYSPRPNDPGSDLSIDKVQKLGPPKQLYSFVGDYDELRGRTVVDALDMLGTGYNGFNRVTGIIFPLHVNLYPANVRGLLQIISDAEIHLDAKDRFVQAGTFNTDELLDIRDININSYPVEAFQKLYPHYCQLARTYFCSSYPSRELIGGLYRDWHPLGFSQRDPPLQPCSIPPTDFCAFSGWDKVRKDFKNHLGSRAFLIQNLDVRDIPGRIMIDFTNPDKDIIPDIGIPPSPPSK